MVTPISPLCLDSTDCCSGEGRPRYKLASSIKVISASLRNPENYRRKPRKKKKPVCLLRKVLLKNTKKAADSFVKGVLDCEQAASPSRCPPPPPSTPPPDDLEEETNVVSDEVNTAGKVEEVFFAIAPCTIL